MRTVTDGGLLGAGRAVCDSHKPRMMVSDCTSFPMEKLKPPRNVARQSLRCLRMTSVLVEQEVPEEISESPSLGRSLSLHKLSVLQTQNNDEQGGLMNVEKEAVQVPLRRARRGWVRPNT